MLYDCDVVLPTAQRYASTKFRRLSRRVRVSALDWGDAIELAALMGVVGHEACVQIFQWNQRTARETAILATWDEAQPYVQANLGSLTEADGLGIFKAMIDGGWKRGKVPRVVADALRAGWERGVSRKKQARELGITEDQVQRIRSPRRKRQTRGIGAVFV